MALGFGRTEAYFVEVNGLNWVKSQVDYHVLSVPTALCEGLLARGINEGQADYCPCEQRLKHPEAARVAAQQFRIISILSGIRRLF